MRCGHDRAVRARDAIVGEDWVTHSYVVVETVTLIHRRLGPEAAASFLDDVLPALRVADVDSDLRLQATAAFRASVGSAVSLVDRTSFELCRREGIVRVFALDADFEAAGFTLVA